MRLSLRSALGIALSAALLAWTLHDVEWAKVLRSLAGANLALFLASTAAATLIFPLRARRWRTILEPVAPGLPFGMLWRSTAIGMMVNNVVPARIGEIARAYALTRETPRVGFGASFASLAVDRLFDALVLLFLMGLAMLSPDFPGATLVAGRPVAQWAGGAALVVLAVLVGLYGLVFFPTRLIGLYEMLARRVAPRFEARGREALLAFASGLGVLRSPTRFVAVLWWTVLHWLLNAFAFWLGFRAVAIDVPYSAALFLQGLIGIGVAVPAAPGFFGTFEALGRTGLAIYGVPATLAVSWALGYHLLSFIPITVIGVVYFVRLGLHFRELATAGSNGEPAAADAAPDATRDDERTDAAGRAGR